MKIIHTTQISLLKELFIRFGKANPDNYREVERWMNEFFIAPLGAKQYCLQKSQDNYYQLNYQL
jgi:hypothetical protein